MMWHWRTTDSRIQLHPQCSAAPMLSDTACRRVAHHVVHSSVTSQPVRLAHPASRMAHHQTPLPRLPALQLPNFAFASPPPRPSPQARSAASLLHTQPRYAAPMRTPGPAAAAAAAAAAVAPRPSPHASAATLRCASCDSDELLENELGYWICQECGAQSQERAALTQEVDEGMYQNMAQVWRTGTRIRKRKIEHRKLTPEEDELVLSQVLLHTYQSLLQLQCRALVLDFGVPAALVGVVGRLWMSYLWQWREVGGWGATHREMIVRRYAHGSSKAQRVGERGRGSRRGQHEGAEGNGDGDASRPPPGAEPDDGAAAAAAADGRAEAVDRKLKRPRREGGASDDSDAEDDDEEEEEAKHDSDVAPSSSSDDDADARGGEKAADAAAAAGTSSSDPDATGTGGLSGGRPRNRPRKQGQHSRHSIVLEAGELSMSLSLALLYLGVHALREPITMQQLCTWALLGRLPYFSPRGVPAPLYERVRKSPTLSSFFHPHGVPSAPRLLALAHRTAGIVAHALEVDAHRQASEAGVVTDDMEIMVHQAQQLRHLVSGSVSLGAGADSVSYGPGGGVASVSSATSHSSLLLRTWLEQLHFPPQLHPVVMELVAQLALSTDKIAEATQPKPRRKRLDGDEPTVSEIHKATTRQQTMMMACLVLALQLTYGAPPPAKPAPLASAEDELDLTGAAVASGLAPDLVRRAQVAAARGSAGAGPGAGGAAANPGASDHANQPAAAPAVSAPGLAAASSSSIATNWSVDVRWPHSVHEARTLPPEQQGPFVQWVSSVVLSRCAPPKDFDLYLDLLGQMASTKPATGVAAAGAGAASGARRGGESDAKGENEAAAPRTLSARAAPAVSSSSGAAPAASSAASSGTSLLSLLSSSSVVAYSGRGTGYFHAAYSSLLKRCCQLIGVPMQQLHVAVQTIIRMAQKKQANTIGRRK